MNTLNYCLNELNNLQSGEIFLVKDLFKGYEWKRLGNKRLNLGTIFPNPSLGIQILNKTSSNQQKYKKI